MTYNRVYQYVRGGKMSRLLIDDVKKVVVTESDCEFIDILIKNGRTWLKLKCLCGEIFEVSWIKFNRKDSMPQRQCKKCGIRKRADNSKLSDEEYTRFKERNGINIRHLEPCVGSHEKIKHECPTCSRQDWEVIPANIMKRASTQCSECGKISMAIKQSHEDIDYEKKKQELGINIKYLEPYVNMHTKIKHECPVCKSSDWLVRPGDILKKNSTMCLKCSYIQRAQNATHSQKEVEEILRKIRCEWIDGEYENRLSKITVMCECGELFTRSFKDIVGHDLYRCSKCSQSESLGEMKVREWLKEHKINFKTQYKFKDLKSDKNRPLPYDFAILDADNKVVKLIEYDGAYHFKPVTKGSVIKMEKAVENLKVQMEHDKIKNDYAKSRNIPLLRIFFLDYKKINDILTNFVYAHDNTEVSN